MITSSAFSIETSTNGKALQCKLFRSTVNAIATSMKKETRWAHNVPGLVLKAYQSSKFYNVSVPWVSITHHVLIINLNWFVEHSRFKSINEIRFDRMENTLMSSGDCFKLIFRRIFVAGNWYGVVVCVCDAVSHRHASSKTTCNSHLITFTGKSINYRTLLCCSVSVSCVIERRRR